MRAVFGGYNIPSQTFMSGRFLFKFAVKLTRTGSQRRTVFLAFPLLNKGLDFRVKCQDMVPPAANVLAYPSVHQMTVWVRPRCQALTISKETNNNKQAKERGSYILARNIKKKLSFIDISHLFIYQNWLIFFSSLSGPNNCWITKHSLLPYVFVVGVPSINSHTFWYTYRCTCTCILYSACM